MAMTKKEREQLEAALTAAALRATSGAQPDIPVPSFNALTKGWLPVGERSDYPRVEPACSNSVYHGIGQQDRTTSQGARKLYSSKLLALRALRHMVEQRCAERLRGIDIMIESELFAPPQTDNGD